MKDKKENFLPELLSPAGNFEKMCAAFRFGADAVYLAGKSFGMRASADNFSDEELKKAVEYAHSVGKKVYLTLNVMPYQHEMVRLEAFLETVKDAAPDAVIVADLGVFSLCSHRISEIPIHISTQAATVNAYSCQKWYEMGARRVVLAREVSLFDIESIRKNIPDELEIETFVHGSMCVSFSGRCMLSQYYTGRDANRGACTQPCRWQYRFYEEKRSDDVLSCEIHPEGSYIFGSKDLCMIDHISDLVNVGIDSLKIEGRMKSAYYTAVVSNVYRIALEKHRSGGEVDMNILHKELSGVSHREYCTGYYFDEPMRNANFAGTSGYIGEKAYLASVVGFDVKSGMYLCCQKNKFSVGDSCEFLTPGRLGEALQIERMFTTDFKEIESCQHPQMQFYLKTDAKLAEGDLIRRSV